MDELIQLTQALPAHAAEFWRSFRFTPDPRILLQTNSAAFDSSALGSWTLLFLLAYVLFALLWRMLPSSGLSKGRLPFVASSRCIGTLHCALVVPMSALAMHQRSGGWNWLSGFDYLAPNLALETRVTEVSVGYFLADFVHFILFEQDVLMFFHHLFSVLMIGSAGVVGRGGSTAVAALFQGEITNPFQSAWTVAKAAKATRLLNILSPLFTAVFVSVRLLLVPLWVVYINAAFLSSPSRSGFPQPLLVSWSVMSAFMTLGGFAWSWALVKGLRKFYKNKSAEAKEAKEKQHKSL